MQTTKFQKTSIALRQS